MDEDKHLLEQPLFPRSAVSLGEKEPGPGEELAPDEGFRGFCARMSPTEEVDDEGESQGASKQSQYF